MKDEFGNAGLELLSMKLKDNTNFDFSIASSLLANVANAKSLNDNIAVNGNMLWRNIDTKIMKEKKKFNSDVSDMLVIEVLKRKELLIENNTSRDLTFSENKRNAWNDVRALLMSKFTYFDLNVEAIKSHWRYRKRKVTDAYQDLKCADSENKIQSKMSPIDFSIFQMLKESNMLEKSGKNDASTASPSEGDDPMLENFPFERSALSSVSPSSAFLQNQQFPQQQHQLNFQQHFQQQLNDIIQNSTQHAKNNGVFQANNDATLPANASSMVERLAAIFLIQQQQRLQQQSLQSQHFIEDLNQTQAPIHFPLSQRTCSSTPSSIDTSDNHMVNIKDSKNSTSYEICEGSLLNNNNIDNENNVNNKCLSMPYTSNCSSGEIMNAAEMSKDYTDKTDASSFITQSTSKTSSAMPNNSIAVAMAAMSTAVASATSVPHRRKRCAQDIGDARPEKLFCHNSSPISNSKNLNQSFSNSSTINASTALSDVQTPELETKTLEDYQKMAFIAQRNAFLDLRSIIADVKMSVLPKLMLTLDNLNDNVLANMNGSPKQKNTKLCSDDSGNTTAFGNFRQSINEVCDVISHHSKKISAASLNAVADEDDELNVEVDEHSSAEAETCCDNEFQFSTSLGFDVAENNILSANNVVGDVDINNNDSKNDVQVNDVELVETLGN